MVTEAVNDTSARLQHLIVTVFGLYGRIRGSIAIADLIALMATLGSDSSAVRSSVSRLKRRGVLVSDRSSGSAGYRLAESLDEVFVAGDERIFHRRRAKIEDPWLLASFSVPEKERPLRHQLRTLLTRQGFGQVIGGFWIAPAIIAEEAQAELRHAGLLPYVELFQGHRVSDEALSEAVRKWWDLDALEELYRDFIKSNTHALDAEVDGAAAFRAYVFAITQWRRLPYLDPGIPLELLPDKWAAIEAERLFDELHRGLAPASEQFVTELLSPENSQT